MGHSLVDHILVNLVEDEPLLLILSESYVEGIYILCDSSFGDSTSLLDYSRMSRHQTFLHDDVLEMSGCGDNGVDGVNEDGVLEQLNQDAEDTVSPSGVLVLLSVNLTGKFRNQTT